MGKWLRRRAEGLQDNAAWYLVTTWPKWLPPVIGLCCALVAHLRHMPVTEWALVALAALIVAAQLLFWKFPHGVAATSGQSTFPVPVNIADTPPKLNLELTPRGDNSPNLYLEVVNQGETVNLSASLRIQSMSTGKPFNGFAYEGLWVSGQARSGVQERTSKIARLTNQASRLLKIASIESASRPGVTQVMELTGINETIMWDFSARSTMALPFCILEVKLLGPDCNEPVRTMFKVGPKTGSGPLQMQEVTT
jgi:hypothetical protein